HERDRELDQPSRTTSRSLSGAREGKNAGRPVQSGRPLMVQGDVGSMQNKPLMGSRAARRACAGPRAERGQSAVEFALVFPILLLLLFFVFEFGRVFGSWLLITNAAR